MDTLVYRGSATLLAEGREVDVHADLTGFLPEFGLTSWSGTLESRDGAAAVGAVGRSRRGRLRLPGGWESAFAVTRIVLGSSVIWVRGSEPDVSPAEWV
ncbi:hypothetical protein KNE206_14210 [Kitasatospora sp. NE20-6]|uniref:hypothetical protein n=1 Tax=Kitasatospora sp. NE20-6 TaxID=2859066 RepID=UPI0034DB8A42